MASSPNSFLKTLPASENSSASAQFTAALLLPFRAARFLWRERNLWRYAALPALVHLALFTGAAALALTLADDALARWIWAEPSGALTLGWYVVYALALIAGLVLAYVAALLVGGVVVSPLNDRLSERTEQVLTGGVRNSDEPLWRVTLRSVASTAFITTLYGVLLVPVLLLNVVPGVGSAAATVLGFTLSAFFLAWEYADICLARHGLGLRRKLRILRRRPALTFGFGAGATLLLWMPLLNVLVMPAAVTGGTALALTLRNLHESA